MHAQRGHLRGHRRRQNDTHRIRRHFDEARDSEASAGLRFLGRLVHSGTTKRVTSPTGSSRLRWRPPSRRPKIKTIFFTFKRKTTAFRFGLFKRASPYPKSNLFVPRALPHSSLLEISDFFYSLRRNLLTCLCGFVTQRRILVSSSNAQRELL